MNLKYVITIIGLLFIGKIECYGRSCNDDCDCRLNQCCEIPVRGRRYPWIGRGQCKPFRGPGDKCFVGSKFTCPCRKGLKCIGTGVTEIPQGEVGVCKPKVRCCNKDSECRKMECCVLPVRGKRSVTSCTGRGKCTPFGKAGDKCFVGSKFTCPCLKGLECIGTGVFEIPQGEVGVCTAKVRCCDKDSDCGKMECCVLPVKGKRSVTSCTGRGKCTPFGKAGDTCHVGHKFTCRCRKGLMCEGIGVIEIPQGERGTCKLDDKKNGKHNG